MTRPLSTRFQKTPSALVPQKRPGQAGGKRSENRRKRTEELTAAALALFLERGLEAVTIDDIVRAAGVAKGSFYRYFDDKAALVASLFAPVTARMREAVATCDAALRAAEHPAELSAAYVALAAALASLVTDEPGVVRLYLQECRGPAVGARAPVVELAAEIRAAAIDLTGAARTHGLLRPLDARVSALAVVGAVERLLFALLAGEDVGPAEEVAENLIALVLDGVRARG